MGKVIKNVVKTVVAAFCGLLVLVLVVPLAVSLAVSVPSVQNAIVHRLTTRLSRSLGTRVSIDRVNVRLINHVELEGFYVEDFDGDTLLYVPRLVAPIEDPGIGGGTLTFGRVKLTGAQIWLRKESADEDMNISRLVDTIRRRSDPNPDSRFRMRIAAIEGDSLGFSLRRGYRERRETGVDFSRLVIRDVSARIEDFSISGDTIRMDINSLEGIERTGLGIDLLSAHPLSVSRGAVVLTDVEIRSRGSELRLPEISLMSVERRWKDFGEFSGSVEMDITMSPSRVTTDLVGALVPAVAGWGLRFDDVALSTGGVLAALTGEITQARTLGTTFSLDFRSRGLPYFETARFDARLTGLTTNADDIASIVGSLTGSRIGDGAAAMLSRAGALSLTGEAAGILGEFEATGVLSSSEAGSLDLAAKVRRAGGITTLDGELSTDGFELGRVSGAKNLGVLAGTFNAAGTIGAGMTGTLNGTIDRLGLHGHTYSGVTIDGRVDGRRYSAEIEVRDEALEADIAASLDRSAQTPRYALRASVDKADLAAMNFDRADSVSLFSGRIVGEISGRGLDDANGAVELRDATYVSGGGTVSTPVVTLEARNNATGKLLSLRSEFADAEFRSRTGYRDMLVYLGGFLQRYIPLPGSGALATFGPDNAMTGASVTALDTPPDGGNPAAASNYSIASLNVKNTRGLLDALAPSASIAEGSSARFMFNPYTGNFSVSALSEFVEFAGMLAADISLTADNAADSLVVYVSGSDIYSERGHIPRFEMYAGAKGRMRADVALDGRVWRVAVDSLGFDGDRVGLDDLNIFAADNPGQRLTATGVVSRSASDTLHVRLNRFDLSPLGRFIRGGRLDTGGSATGRLDVAGARGNPKIDADMELRDLAAMSIEAPPLRFMSRPGSGGGVDYSLVNEETGDNLVTGSLSSAGEIKAEVRLETFDAALLDPFLDEIIENTHGNGSARLTLRGTLRSLKVDGLIEVPRLETTVSYTGVRYGVEDARIAVENSVLTLPATRVSNPEGGTGDIAMRVDLSNLRDIGAEIEARADALLAFDTGADDNEAFYGRVFATGTVGIRSGRMGTVMNISGRTDAGTRLHLPLNAKSNVSWADFVVFADRTSPPDTTDVLARKKLAYERGLLAAGGRARRAKPLELNLTVGVTPAAEMHMLIDPNLGQGITGRGEGVIDMRINPTTDLFTMTGDYNISNGRFEFSMMDVFNKTFEIAPGSTLRWTGAPTDALLSIDASYRVRTSLLPLVGEGSGLAAGRQVPVDCIIRLRDRLSEPEITFDIALPSADAEARQIVAGAMNTEELKSMQFLSLLTTGSFATDNSITGQAANSGMMATGAVGFDILTNQLNNFLSGDDYDIYFRYRPQENFDTNQFEAGFSTSLWDDRLQLEIEGNYVDDRAATSVGTSAATNLVGDVSLTWVIDRSGNLRLKVFSQSIDRMTEDQGRQESGLGIYYKKDFDAIGDIFRRNNSKFAPDSVIVKKRQIKNNK